MKRYICILLLLSLLLLPSCARNERSAEDIFFDVCEKLPPLSFGKLYLSDRSAGDAAFMSPALFESLFGADVSPLVEEYAIYLSSFAFPCEVAIFKCFSPSETSLVERACLSRLDLLRRYFKDTEHASTVDSAYVMKKGLFVIFIVSAGACELHGKIERLL